MVELDKNLVSLRFGVFPGSYYQLTTDLPLNSILLMVANDCIRPYFQLLTFACVDGAENYYNDFVCLCIFFYNIGTLSHQQSSNLYNLCCETEI